MTTTTSQAGRKGIAARIEKHGREKFLESCRKSGKSRTTRLTPKRRREISLAGVEAREKKRMLAMGKKELAAYLEKFPHRAELLK